MSKVENIKVAVRLRPFNTREKSKQCRNVVSMIERTTLLTNPAITKSLRRQFRFDFSYWSHDGFTVTKDGYYEPTTDKYIDQKRMFSALGVGLLDNAWSGYNCTIFAYGQTGSGKSYSMMGYEPNTGMIPMLGENLFQGITDKKNSDVIFKVSVSMLEIYNEKVQDLLIDKNHQPQNGLTVRMSPKHGFYVEGLSQFAVSTCTDITYYIESGNKNRTLAATKMNETSSRAHTIVIISFTQNFIKENKSKQSKIYMVDLAGSERAAQTGATGARFQESKNINKSLMTLGTVIKNLCAIACGRTDEGPTPYRDSKLTMLLKDAIGGNCKTIMVATISPSEEDYEQTLSTLRYADRVKSIKNIAIKNVEATDKLIQELLAEKQALLDKLKTLPRSVTGYTEEDLRKLKEEQAHEIEQLKNEMQNVEAAWQKQLQDAKKQMEKQLESEQKLERDRKRIPHLWNLNEDPSLSKKIFHFIKDGEAMTVGNRRSSAKIELHGPSITKQHAVLHNRHGEISIKPLQGVVKVNGKPIKQQTTVKHQDSSKQQSIRHLLVLLSFHASKTVNQYCGILKLPRHKDSKVQISLKNLDIPKDTLWVDKLNSLSYHCFDESSIQLDKTMATNLFILHLPSKQREIEIKDKLQNSVTYEMAQGEIAKYLEDAKSNGVDWLKQELAEILMLTQESNAMAREMEKDIVFEPLVLAKHYAKDVKRTKVYILVRSGNGGEFLWGRNHFLDRYDLMTDMYQKFIEGDKSWEPMSPTQDPFWEPLETPTLIGLAYVPLESIAYMLDIEEQKIGIYDYQAGHAGYLNVSLVPCTSTGEECSEERAVEEPSELVGQNISFKVKIKGATGIPKRFKTSWCHYTFYNDDKRYYTDEKMGVVPKYNYEQMHDIKNVGCEEIEYLEDCAIVMEVYGRQGSSYDQRRGSSFTAYTMSDVRRLSHVMPILPTSSMVDHGSLWEENVSTSSISDGKQDHGFENESKDMAIKDTEQDANQEELSHMIDEILNNMSETGDTQSDISGKPNEDININKTPDNTCSKFTEMKKGISSLVDEIMKRNETGIEPPDEVEQILDLSSNTSLQILRDVLQSTTNDLQKSERNLTTAHKKMERIDNILKSREDTLAMEIKQILED